MMEDCLESSLKTKQNKNKTESHCVAQAGLELNNPSPSAPDAEVGGVPTTPSNNLFSKAGLLNEFKPFQLFVTDGLQDCFLKNRDAF